jgi:uncharacterized protein (TIGR02611 family)
LKSRTVTRVVYRVVVGLVGCSVVALGLILVPFPGPGWLIVIVGLGILATEFAWAQGLLRKVRHQVAAWTAWISAASWPVRALVALGAGVGVAAALYLTALVVGVPGWVPDGLVPDLPGL